MSSKTQHVLPHKKGWAVRGENSRKATAVFSSKQEAIDRAQEIAKSSGSEVLVHGANGQIFRRLNFPSSREARFREAVREVSGLYAKPR